MLRIPQLAVALVGVFLLAPTSLGASVPAQLDHRDVLVERGAPAPGGLAATLRRKAAALRLAGVPTKFVILRGAHPRRAIPYSATLRKQHRRRTGEDANVIIMWPLTGMVAFDARVPDPEEEAAWLSNRSRIARSMAAGLTSLAQRLASDDPISGGSQPRRGPLEVLGPQGSITARPCVKGDLDEGCRGSASDLVFSQLPFEATLRVTVTATCLQGAGPYRVGVAPPSGFTTAIGSDDPDPVVCAGPGPGTASYSEQRVFEYAKDLYPGPRGANATWNLLVNDQPVADSSLQILKRDYEGASTRIISERNRDEFFNTCLDGKHRLWSAGGVLHCSDYTDASAMITMRTGP